jgi:MFS family permease
MGESPSSSPLGRKSRRLGRWGYSVSACGVGVVFAAFDTYVLYQIQTIAYFIGHEDGKPPGTGCSLTATVCYVPFYGSGDLNLTTFLLYLNALAFAISGAVVLLLSGVSDHLGFYREQYVGLLVIYGAFCLPVAGLQGLDTATFTAFSGLFVTFNVVGFVAGPLLNSFTALVMYSAEEVQASSTVQDIESKPPGIELATDWIEEVSQANREKQGVSMSVWGAVGLYGSQAVLFCIGIGLTYTNATTGGLYLTTASGAFCILCVLLAWPLLPSRPRLTEKLGTRQWLALIIRDIKEFIREMRTYPEAFKFLVAYTIYSDTLLTFGSVTAQMFNLSVRPTALGYTIYSLVGTITTTAATIGFGFVFPLTLEKIPLLQWTIFSYGLTAFCAMWCSIGISESAQIGLKHHWEFYFIQVVQSIGLGITNASFRVTYAELFPPGKEIQYFGFQLVLSACTAWIPSVVNGPIVEASGLLRLPAALSAAMFVLSFGLGLWTNVTKGIRDVASRISYSSRPE